MSHSYANDRAARAGQWALDNMDPGADDGDEWPQECEECAGTGEVLATDENSGTTADERHADDKITCPCCDGTGLLDEDGEPWSDGDYD